MDYENALEPLPNGWEYMPLEDSTTDKAISYGIVQPGSYDSDGVPIVRVNNFRNGALILHDVLKVSKDIESKYSRTRLKGGEVLLTLVGSIGQVVIAPQELKGWNVARAIGVLRVRPEINADWVRICLESPQVQRIMGMVANTTVQATVNLKDVRALPIPIPPPSERIAITEVINALDKKIELNHKMNATLEQMAQALFKSWFVDFDPVKAKAQGRTPEGIDAETAALFPSEFEESELGQIPKSWRVAVLDEAFDINPSRKLAKSKAATYLDMGNVPTSGHRPTAWIKRAAGSGARFTNGDTLLARITPCLENGKTAFVDFLCDGEVGWGSTEFIVLRPKQGLPDYFAYLLCRREDFRAFAIQSMTGTSGRQRVQTNSLAKYKLALPESGSLIGMNFGECVAPLAKRIKAASEESATLANLRDALLPKLISGQLRIPDAEKMAEAAL
jgi:type I restriction enzyme S subunit